jgi:acyl-homoserine lactone acylase PvdQ
MGTIVAEDRLFQITFKSYALQGRLAEFVGEKSLDHDKFMRELNLRKWADLRAERFRKEN